MVDKFCQERMKNVFSQMKKQVMQHLLQTEGRIVGQRNKIDNQEAAISPCIRCQQCMNLKIDRMTGTCQMNLEGGPKIVLGEIHRHGSETTDGNPGIQMEFTLTRIIGMKLKVRDHGAIPMKGHTMFKLCRARIIAI
jgi:hypothetical protein